jgi:O-acetyl-ADP-ribose deacetylase (regulator of RNase III)
VETEFLNGRVKVLVGNITRQEVDAIVNAANSSLLGGGGVDGAVHDAGGEEILRECREIRKTSYPKGLPTGESVITTAGKMPAKFVIHTVGPIKGIDRQNEASQLANCYRNSLNLAVANDCQTIAFPAISTGIYAYPKDQAAEISSIAVKEFLLENDSITEVRFIFFMENEARIFLQNQKF